MTDYKTVFQLAQDKGCYTYTQPSNKNGDNNKTLDEELQEIESSYVGNTKELVQQMRLMIIQKWLRDEHKVAVIPTINERLEPFYFDCIIVQPAPEDNIYKTSIQCKLATYEQALLEGIHEALKIIP